MKFEKGNSGNPYGRPKGSKNKTGEELRNLISGFLEKRFAGIVKDYKTLATKDRIKVYVDLLQYSVPKLQGISTDTGFERLTDEQFEEIINRLIRKHEEA